MDTLLIRQNLTRQGKALHVLHHLLMEEFSHLLDGEPEKVSIVEMALQELMRQIAVERLELKSMLGSEPGKDVRLADSMDKFSPEDQKAIMEVTMQVDEMEQTCARQADKNRSLALALFDQSSSMIHYLHDQVKPKNTTAYSANGRFAKAPKGAPMVSGRL
ncbi:MAG: flagellar export chaperone FlgN [Desulfovibrio sp.]|uniref:flagellar export chaperone FlgN n=1 Tax=Desulfovibrio sp. 7SRBS1 TaxID=3378064 RepID=UPI003B3C069F